MFGWHSGIDHLNVIMSELFQGKYRIKSARLEGWNYAWPGVYFITIKIQYGKDYFGKVVNGKMQLSKIGEIVKREWLNTPKMRENVELDEWVIMPNHLHLILFITNKFFNGIPFADDFDPDEYEQKIGVYDNTLGTHTVETRCSASLQQSPSQYKNKFGIQSNNLSSIIRGFKCAATNQIHTSGFFNFVWQTRFHDRVIRNENELNIYREYTRNNPMAFQEKMDEMRRKAALRCGSGKK